MSPHMRPTRLRRFHRSRSRRLGFCRIRTRKWLQGHCTRHIRRIHRRTRPRRRRCHRRLHRPRTLRRTRPRRPQRCLRNRRRPRRGVCIHTRTRHQGHCKCHKHLLFPHRGPRRHRCHLRPRQMCKPRRIRRWHQGRCLDSHTRKWGQVHCKCRSCPPPRCTRPHCRRRHQSRCPLHNPPHTPPRRRASRPRSHRGTSRSLEPRNCRRPPRPTRRSCTPPSPCTLRTYNCRRLCWRWHRSSRHPRWCIHRPRSC